MKRAYQYDKARYVAALDAATYAYNRLFGLNYYSAMWMARSVSELEDMAKRANAAMDYIAMTGDREGGLRIYRNEPVVVGGHVSS